MAFGSGVLVLALIGFLAIVVVAVRSSRGSREADGGGSGIGIAVLLVGIVVVGLVGGGVLLFSVSSGTMAAFWSAGPPAPGDVSVRVVVHDHESGAVVDAIEGLVPLALAEGVTIGSSGSSTGSVSGVGMGEASYSEARFTLAPAAGTDASSQRHLRPDALDFDVLLEEVRLALPGLVPSDLEPGQLDVVVAFRAGDGSVLRAANLMWIDGVPVLTEFPPDEIFGPDAPTVPRPTTAGVGASGTAPLPPGTVEIGTDGERP